MPTAGASIPRVSPKEREYICRVLDYGLHHYGAPDQRRVRRQVWPDIQHCPRNFLKASCSCLHQRADILAQTVGKHPVEQKHP